MYSVEFRNHMSMLDSYLKSDKYGLREYFFLICMWSVYFINLFKVFGSISGMTHGHMYQYSI